LGDIYKSQSKSEQAEKMHERVLRGYEKTWRPGHTLTLFTVNNLGLLYADQSKFREAEKMYKWAQFVFKRCYDF
jgi:hypothetical protein